VITADQLLCHAIGDYLIQSDWMAMNKTKRSLPCFVHALSYAGVFAFFLTPSVAAVVVIAATHFIIDRWRLARFVVYAKNFPWEKWEDCIDTGYYKSRPAWMAVWLLIIADNILHVAINGLAIRHLR